MRRVTIFLVGLVISSASLASLPAQAGGPCYHLRVSYRGTELLDQWVGVGCSPNTQQLSVQRQVVGDTIVEMSRYASR